MSGEAAARRALRLSRGLFGGYPKDRDSDRLPDGVALLARPSGHGQRVDRAL